MNKTGLPHIKVTRLSLRPVAFRPRLASGLALSIKVTGVILSQKEGVFYGPAYLFFAFLKLK